MEDVINLGGDIIVQLNPIYSKKVATYPFPPFGFLDLYVNLGEGIIIFFMKPRYKDENNPGFAKELFGPSDIIRLFETQLANLKTQVAEYTGISIEKKLKPMQPPSSS